jgi:hypothetical protein
VGNLLKYEFNPLAKAAIHILQTPKPSQKPFAARVCLPNRIKAQ